jgi:hypothetical protein
VTSQLGTGKPLNLFYSEEKKRNFDRINWKDFYMYITVYRGCSLLYEDMSLKPIPYCNLYYTLHEEISPNFFTSTSLDQ